MRRSKGADIMDSESVSTLRTVCAAGCAREGFNEETNERLDQLSGLGLLVVAYAPGLLSHRRTYQPTAKGRAFCELPVDKGTA